MTFLIILSLKMTGRYLFSLVKPDNLQELVKFVTEDPPTDAEDAVRFKYVPAADFAPV